MTEAGGNATRVVGRAMTHGSTLPLGVEDPIEASRAVRRALADAGRKAADIDRLVVATSSSVSGATLRSFARRALGPAGEGVAIMSLVGGGSADALSGLACTALEFEGTDVRTAIAVGLDADGTTIALCVEPCDGHASRSSGDRARQ